MSVKDGGTIEGKYESGKKTWTIEYDKSLRLFTWFCSANGTKEKCGSFGTTVINGRIIAGGHGYLRTIHCAMLMLSDSLEARNKKLDRGIKDAKVR